MARIIIRIMFEDVSDEEGIEIKKEIEEILKRIQKGEIEYTSLPR